MSQVIESLVIGTGNPNDVPAPLYILLDGQRVGLRVDPKHCDYEMSASQARQIAYALQRAAELAEPREVPLAIVKALVAMVESDNKLEGLFRPEIDAAKAWLAQAER
jgi:hypothetical protein